jgi:ribosomal protein L16 Arg81 hydroxylase
LDGEGMSEGTPFDTFGGEFFVYLVQAAGERRWHVSAKTGGPHAYPNGIWDDRGVKISEVAQVTGEFFPTSSALLMALAPQMVREIARLRTEADHDAADLAQANAETQDELASARAEGDALRSENARLRTELVQRGNDPLAVDARQAFLRLGGKADRLEREQAEDRAAVRALLETIPRCSCGDVADEHNRHDGWTCDKCSMWPQGLLLRCAPALRNLLARVVTWGPP